MTAPMRSQKCLIIVGLIKENDMEMIVAIALTIIISVIFMPLAIILGIKLFGRYVEWLADVFDI